MNYGSVRITTPDGQVREHPLESPSVAVGRSPENRIVIEHVTVSRRHARITIDSGMPFIEDLGSDSGTFVGGERLQPGQRHLFSTEPVRLGDVQLAYAPPAAPTTTGPITTPISTTTGPISQPVTTAQSLGISLAGPSGSVAPGGITTATVQVHNRGSIVDEVTIRVPDLPPGWVEVSRAMVPLLPGAREEVVVTIRPPRSNEAVAGDRTFTVSAASRVHGTEVGAVGILTVQPFGGFNVALAPIRGERDFRVNVENTGNSPLAVQLSAVDEEGRMRFDFANSTVRLGPGETQSVPLRVKLPGAPKFGNEVIKAFRIDARPAHGELAPVSASGQLRVKPGLEAWRLPAIGLVVIAALAGGGVTYAAKCEDWGLPGCSANAETPPADPEDQTATATAAGQATIDQRNATMGTTPQTTATAPPNETTTAPTTPPASPTTPAPPTVPTAKVMTFPAADRVLDPRSDYLATVATTRGDFVVDLNIEETYKLSNSFAFLAMKGFYEGMTFRAFRDRIESGDPDGHGLYNPGYFTEAERSRATNKRSTVAFIPYTRDVEAVGSAWYVNRTDNEQLSDHPVFGQVIRGMDVVDKIQPGDTILRISIDEK